ncbi:hypothetical protein NHQ30_003120 [Ciborinia camelliae]|nr:hypothetical protein NHQ30_003120 [Ciborinia camelliae]
MCQNLEEDKTDIPEYYRTHDGELIYGPSEPQLNDPKDIALLEKMALRTWVLCKFTKTFTKCCCGVNVKYGQEIEKYFEDEDVGPSGVMTESGSIRVTYIVVAAGSAKSQCEILIAGEHMASVSSGMSVSRASYPGHLVKEDPALQKR